MANTLMPYFELCVISNVQLVWVFFPVHNELVFQGFCDNDCGGCTMIDRSVTGFYLKPGSAFISWKAKKQSVTSQSTADAEYHALASVVAVCYISEHE